MIESMAYKLAIRIKSIVPEHPSSVDILKYALALVLNAFFIIGSSLIISTLTGKILEVVLVLSGFALLRQLSGGLHLKTGMSCVIVSTLAATGVSMFKVDNVLTILITIIALICVVLWSPTNIENTSKIKKRYYPYLKVLSSLLVLANLIIQSDMLAFAYLLQGITLFLGRR